MSRVVDNLIAALGRLPGVGQKTSQRLAYHLLRVAKEEALGLARAIELARASIKTCSQCFHLDETDPCGICSDQKRNRELLLVVEDPRDLQSFEESGFTGIYHVLGGRLSSLDDVGPDDLTMAALLARVQPPLREVCLATNPDLEGEGTARWIAEQLAGRGVAVTRLARGIPAGSTITQVGKSILADAIEGRRPLGA